MPLRILDAFPLILDFKWVASCIFLSSVFYAYLLSRLETSPSPMINTVPTAFANAHLARSRQLHVDQREFEAMKRRIVASSFPFMNLPPEICLLILRHCSEWPNTFRSLVLVSLRVRQLTYEACLSHMPIRLIGESQILSFNSLLRRESQLACLVHHLWVTPLREDLLDIAAEILKICVNVRTLACNSAMLQDAVISAIGECEVRHTQCQQFTLLYSRLENCITLLDLPKVHPFFRQLTHLRLTGDHTPRRASLPRLTNLSYAFNQAKFNLLTGQEMLQDKEAFPSLRSIILTRERLSGGGLRISKVKDARIYTIDIPCNKTELEMWCDNALGRGMWELCADPRGV